MGHNGVNCFIESDGSGTANTSINHPGDLFINKFCRRNVMFFSHFTPFATSVTNVVSIVGSLNVRTKMQLGDGSSTTFSDAYSKLYIYTPPGASVGNGIRIKHGSAGYSGVKIASFNDATAFTVSNGTGLTTDGPIAFRIESDGKTQIGVKSIVSTHLHANSFVQVDGKMACKELVIIDPTKWSDFVFFKNYNLMSLKEVEKFYLKNKHLPDVPNGDEVMKNGINAAEMDALLLQKIEELTIHLVALSRKIENLEKENKELKNK